MVKETRIQDSEALHRIIVFARAPNLGMVKTRLNKTMPLDQVLQLHKRMVRHTIANAVNVSGACVELWVDENPSHTFFQSLNEEYPALSIRVQVPGDLGARMSYALNQSVDGAQVSLLIGSDCPAIDNHYLAASIDGLTEHDLVIGPASDGGYVLIGTKQTDLPVFEDIDWGTDQVLRQTLQLAVQSEMKVRLMAELNDVDHAFDLGEAHRFGLLDA